MSGARRLIPRTQRQPEEPPPDNVVPMTRPSSDELREMGIHEPAGSVPVNEPRARHQQDGTRAMPHAHEAEFALLSSVVKNPAIIGPAFDRSPTGAFDHPGYRRLAELLLELHEDGQPLEFVAIGQALEDRGELAKVGGPAVISELFTFVPTAANWDFYADVVRQKHELRELIKTCRKYEARAFDEHGEVRRLLEEFEDQVRGLGEYQRTGGLPDMDDVSMMTGENRPPMPPEIVRHLLHQGSKIIIGGTSKGRKTFSLLDLAISVATGTPWWGFETIKGRVCYINFEIQRPFFVKRYEDICRKKEVLPLRGQFMSWTLRGMVDGIEKMSAQMIKALQDHDFSLIVVDPIYKALGDRDENKAGDVASMMNELERIAVKTGAAIAFGAHFSKGNQANKEAADRIGGSGVFHRDPDALLTMTPHEQAECFVVETSLRNFPPMDPFVVRWEWPLFVRDEALDPENLKQPKKGGNQGGAGKFEEKYAIGDVLDLMHGQNTGRTPMELRRWVCEQTLMSVSTFKRLWRQIKATRYVEERRGRYFVTSLYTPTGDPHQKESKLL